MEYEVMFLRPDGKAWSLAVWKDRLEISAGKNTRRMADCFQLSGLLGETWRARSAGEVE